MNVLNPSSFSITKYPSKSSCFGISLSNRENVFNSTSDLSCGILRQIIEKIFSFGNKTGSAKSESLVTSMRFFDFESIANLPFEIPFGARITSNPFDLKIYVKYFGKVDYILRQPNREKCRNKNL